MRATPNITALVTTVPIIGPDVLSPIAPALLNPLGAVVRGILCASLRLACFWTADRETIAKTF